MKNKFSIPFKWAIFISLLIIPYYIHCARIDRILNNYTSKSNALFLVLQEKEVSKGKIVFNFDFFLASSNSLCPIYFLFNSTTVIYSNINQTKKFFIYSDIPPPASFA